jgi:hypothetical protein
LQSQDLDEEHQTMTVYVVARTDSGEPNPLHGVTLQLRNPRHHPDVIDARTWTWTIERRTGGLACAGDPNSLCVPLA